MNAIGIVGTGAMGRGIAQIAAQAGLRVRLFDASPQAVEAARGPKPSHSGTTNARWAVVGAGFTGL
ncbi:3-hydroxyacyl-CoA dehydrogenase NAD-binding domain-containing protein, partial [Ralstonia pseudosolanacearum]|uniref:3-hydroxyacyl-CoA dehydrogenase NAD-binding domain-containing protein n=1 Tax=Ralstonia pseudosolanacearum TaxID=1310165 RepID=UPI003CED6F15